MIQFTRFSLVPSLRPLMVGVILTALLPFTSNAQCPTIEAIMVDACGNEESNEFVVINSGGGFNTSELQLSFDMNNNIIDPGNNDINIDINNLGADPTPCGLMAGNTSVLTGCPNLVSVGPGVNIPPNSTLVLLTSSGAGDGGFTDYDFSGMCGAGECVYVIQSTCFRSAGGFSNSAGSGTRETILGLSSGCSTTYIYDRASITGGNGGYFIPPGTYGNSGCAAPPVSAGPPPPDFNNPGPQVICGSYTLPAITGTNLTGNEAYFTLPNGQGTQYAPGQMITSTANIFIFDPTAPCSDEETFSVTITPAPTANIPASSLDVCVQTTPPSFTENLSTIINEITGGSPSLMVNWYTDMAGTMPFNPNSIGSYPPPPTTITIYATVDNGSCESTTVPVTVNVNFFPTANPQTLTECDDGSGQATFDLTSLDNSVSPGNTVSWFTNAAATIPVGNPSAFVSSGGTVYATATNAGGCTSAPVMITLDLVPALTSANTTITIDPTSACGSATINITFNFPASGTYDVILEYTDPTNGTQTLPVTVTGMNPNPVNIAITETTTFSLVSAGYNGTTCVYTFPNPVVETATITTGPVIDDIADVNQCGSYMLPTITGTNLTGNEGYFSGSGGTGTQFFPGQTISTSTTLFIYDGTPGCNDEESFTITINPVPNLQVSGTLDYCAGATIDLSTLVNDLNNSGFPITFHTGTPANAGNQLPSSTVSPGTTTTYYAAINGPTGCTDEAPITITITTTPTAQNASMMLCATSGNQATFDLTTLEGTVSGGSGSVNWFQDAGLTTPIGTPGAFTTGTTTVFATVSAGACTSNAATITLTVNAAPMVMNIPTQQICGTGGGAVFDLTTLENSIHNGTADQVTWYTDAALTNQIGNPSAFSTTGITVYAVASLGGCEAAPVAVELIVSDTTPPTAPTPPTACDNGSGQATFDLTQLESQMNVFPGFQVNWYPSPPPATPIANPSSYTGSGPVYATVSQDDCESIAVEVTFNILPIPTANPAGPITVCDDGSGQALVNLTENDLQINGGTGLTVNWFQDSGGAFPINNPGSFLTGSTTVFARVDNGSCASAPVAVQIIVSPGPLANNAQTSICNQGGNQATFDLTALEGQVSGGTGNVNWFFDVNGNTPINTPNAFTTPTTQVFAIVSNGACTSMAATVTLTVNEIPTIIPVPTLITCNGAEDGTLSILVQDGLMPYLFDWSDNQFDGSSDLTDLAPGVYALTVTDANNCSESASVTISQPDALDLECAELAPVSAPGGNDGQASITLTGGTAPYDITYTGPVMGSITGSAGGNITLDNLEAGTYNLTVVDDNNCTLSCTFTITDPDCAINLMITGTNLSCNGGADGTIELTVNNAADPYTIDWSFDDIDGEENPTGLMAGTYFVTVTDANDCQSSTSVTLSQPPAMTITCGESLPVSMDGAADGEAEVTISGGAGPYLVEWTGPVNGSQTQNTTGTFSITGLEAGSYTVTITDDQDCTIECMFIINGASGCNLTVSLSGTEPGCFGDSTGTITLTVNNPIGDYTVIWTDEQYDGMEDLTNVPAGAYATIVTDEAGCEASAFIILGQPDELQMTCGEGSPTSAPGANDGVAEISVMGGTAPYMVSWTGPASGTQSENAAGTFNITGLPAGVYEVTITDDTGCTVDCMFVINPPNCILTLGITGTDPVCAGEASGTIDLVITDAANPYTVDWNVDAIDGQENPTDLLAGNYAVTVTDANDCIVIGEVTLTEPDAILISCAQSVPESMPGTENGEAEITFINGTAPYTVSWIGPVIGNQIENMTGTITITGLSAGNYTVTVTDANGCTATCDFPISNVECMLSLNVATEDASCPDAGDGKINVEVVDGNGPFTFDWTPDVYDGLQTLDMLDQGTYIVVVTDSDGCMATDTIALGTQFPAPSLTFSEGGMLCDDDCFTFDIEFTGIPPYILSYDIVDNVGTLNFEIEVAGQDTIIEVCSADFSNSDSVVVNLIYLKQANCITPLDLSEVVDLGKSTESFINNTICANEFIEVNGTIYDIDNPSGQEILSMGNADGCDSIINVNLAFFDEISSTLDTMICSTDSVIIGGVVFTEFNPVGEVIFPSAVSNCDSVVNVFVNFFPAAESEFSTTLCPGDSLIFNGTVYNQENFEGTETLPGASALGCDSLIKITLEFFDSSSFVFEPVLCPGESIVFNGETYDQSNPSGIEALEGAAANGCDSFVVVNVTFFPEAIADFTTTLCNGDSLIFNGTVYNAANPTGTEILTGASVNGCDSIVNVSLEFLPDPESDLILQACPSESITFNGTVYDINNTSGTEVLVGASINGCDSIVNVTLEFLPEPSGDLNLTVCNGDSIIVNGTVYNATNPSGTETLVGAASNGCDSILNVSLEFLPDPMGQFMPTICPGESITFNGTVYDANNPTGTEVLQGASANGCDSIVTISVSFLPEPMGEFTPTLCPGESITFNGTVYDETNPAGTETLTGAAANGCDSIVNVNVGFLPPPTGDFMTTLCFGESLTFNGTVYDANNPMGTELLVGASANGCDSTVNVSVSFLPEPIGDFMTTICPGESLTFNGTVYDENNPTGTEVLTGASVEGCDSTVNVSVSFFPPPTPGNFTPTICENGSIVFNGTTYDANNPTGTETLMGASVNGCDSTVNVALSFYPAAMGNLMTTICPGESLIINGTQYDESNPTGTEILAGASINGCDSTLNVSLSFFAPATSDFTDTLCEGESLVFNGTTYDANNPTGTETLVGAASNGCDSIINISLDFLPAPEAGLTGSTSICGGESTSLTFVLSGGSSFDITYSDGINPPVDLTNIINGFSITVNPGGTSTFTILSATVVGSDCPVNITTSAEVVVSQLASGIQITTDYDGFAVSCENSEDGAVTAEATQGVPPYNYTWNTGAQTPSLDGLGIGIYTVSVTDATGCTSETQVTLDAPPGIVASLTTISPPCFGDPTGSIVIDTISGGTGPFEYSLNGEFFNTVASLPFVVNAVEPGSYTLSIQDANDCATEVAANVFDAQQLVLDLGADDELLLGETYVLEGLVNFEVASATWTPADSLSAPDSLITVAMPQQTTTYTLTAVDANGCVVSDQITLFVNRDRNVYIPNIFTPNEDGVNDFFGVFGGKDVVVVKTFKIFDRWGNLVYENGPFAPNDMSYGWDGTFNGKLMNPAVFVYYAELEFVDGETEVYKGDVTLMR